MAVDDHHGRNGRPHRDGGRRVTRNRRSSQRCRSRDRTGGDIPRGGSRQDERHGRNDNSDGSQNCKHTSRRRHALASAKPQPDRVDVPDDGCESCGDGNNSMCRDWEIFGEHCDGTYAQFIAAPAHAVMPIPDGIDFVTAAAPGLTFLTAWRLTVTRGRLRAGEDVLIHGVGAGVGTVCLQIAKMVGARAIVTASSDEKLEKAKALGADVCINYAKDDWPKKIREVTAKRGVDLVVDYIGKETWSKSLMALRRGGRLTTCGATTGYDPVEDIRQIFYRQLEIIGCTMGSNKEFHDVMRCFFQGRLKPVIDSVLPLKDAAEAHARIESRKVFGKVMLAT